MPELEEPEDLVTAARERDADIARRATKAARHVGIIVEESAWRTRADTPVYKSIDRIAVAYADWPEFNGVKVEFYPGDIVGTEYRVEVGHNRIMSRADLGDLIRRRYPALVKVVASGAAVRAGAVPHVDELEQLRHEAKAELMRMEEQMGVMVPDAVKVDEDKWWGWWWWVAVVVLVIVLLLIGVA